MSSACPPEVLAAIDAYPPAVRKRLRQLRRIILRTARRLDIGELVETTKWGEPAYLPGKTRIGTTLRMGTRRGDATSYRLYVHCQTNLIETFKTLFPELAYEGNRAVVFAVEMPPPEDIVALMTEAALTYHRRS